MGFGARVSGAKAHDVRQRRNRTSPPLSQPHPSSPSSRALPPRPWTHRPPLDLSHRLPHRRRSPQQPEPTPSARRSCSSPLRTKAARVPRQLACIGQFQSPWPAAPLPVPAWLRPSFSLRTLVPPELERRRRQHARRQRVLSPEHNDCEPTRAIPSISAWTPALCHPRSVPFLRTGLTAPAPSTKPTTHAIGSPRHPHSWEQPELKPSGSTAAREPVLRARVIEYSKHPTGTTRPVQIGRSAVLGGAAERNIGG